MNLDGLPTPALQVSASSTFPGYDTDILNQALIHESSNIKVDKTLSGENLRFPIPCENNEVPIDFVAVRQTKTKWFHTYEPGFVRNVTPNCLDQFVNDIKDIGQPTGCIVNEMESLSSLELRGLDPGLVEAVGEANQQQSMLPIIKNELKHKILLHRLRSGKGDIDIDEKKPKIKRSTTHTSKLAIDKVHRVAMMDVSAMDSLVIVVINARKVMARNRNEQINEDVAGFRKSGSDRFRSVPITEHGGIFPLLMGTPGLGSGGTCGSTGSSGRTVTRQHMEDVAAEWEHRTKWTRTGRPVQQMAAEWSADDVVSNDVLDTGSGMVNGSGYHLTLQTATATVWLTMNNMLTTWKSVFVPGKQGSSGVWRAGHASHNHREKTGWSRSIVNYLTLSVILFGLLGRASATNTDGDIVFNNPDKDCLLCLQHCYAEVLQMPCHQFCVSCEPYMQPPATAMKNDTEQQLGAIDFDVSVSYESLSDGQVPLTASSSALVKAKLSTALADTGSLKQADVDKVVVVSEDNCGKMRCQKHIFHDGMAYNDPNKECLRCYEICRSVQNAMKASCLSACKDHCPLGQHAPTRMFETTRRPRQELVDDQRTSADDDFPTKWSSKWLLVLFLILPFILRYKNDADVHLHMSNSSEKKSVDNSVDGPACNLSDICLQQVCGFYNLKAKNYMEEHTGTNDDIVGIVVNFFQKCIFKIGIDVDCPNSNNHKTEQVYTRGMKSSATTNANIQLCGSRIVEQLCSEEETKADTIQTCGPAIEADTLMGAGQNVVKEVEAGLTSECNAVSVDGKHGTVETGIPYLWPHIDMHVVNHTKEPTGNIQMWDSGIVEQLFSEEETKADTIQTCGRAIEADTLMGAGQCVVKEVEAGLTSECTAVGVDGKHGTVETGIQAGLSPHIDLHVVNHTKELTQCGYEMTDPPYARAVLSGAINGVAIIGPESDSAERETKTILPPPDLEICSSWQQNSLSAESIELHQQSTDRWGPQVLPSSGILPILQSFCEADNQRYNSSDHEHLSAKGSTSEFLQQLQTVAKQHDFFYPGYTPTERERLPSIYRNILHMPSEFIESYTHDAHKQRIPSKLGLGKGSLLNAVKMLYRRFHEALEDNRDINTITARIASSFHQTIEDIKIPIQARISSKFPATSVSDANAKDMSKDTSKDTSKDPPWFDDWHIKFIKRYYIVYTVIECVVFNGDISSPASPQLKRINIIQRIIDVSRFFPDPRRFQSALVTRWCQDRFMRQELMKCVRMPGEYRTLELVKLLTDRWPELGHVIQRETFDCQYRQHVVEKSSNLLKFSHRKSDLRCLKRELSACDHVSGSGGPGGNTRDLEGHGRTVNPQHERDGAHTVNSPVVNTELKEMTTTACREPSVLACDASTTLKSTVKSSEESCVFTSEVNTTRKETSLTYCVESSVLNVESTPMLENLPVPSCDEALVVNSSEDKVNASTASEWLPSNVQCDKTLIVHDETSLLCTVEPGDICDISPLEPDIFEEFETWENISNEQLLGQEFGSSVPMSPVGNTTDTLSFLDTPGTRLVSEVSMADNDPVIHSTDTEINVNVPNAEYELSKKFFSTQADSVNKVVPSRDIRDMLYKLSDIESATQTGTGILMSGVSSTVQKGSRMSLVVQEEGNDIDLALKLKGHDLGSDLTAEELQRLMRECTWLSLHQLPIPNISLSVYPQTAVAPLDEIFRQMVHQPNLGPRITMKYELLRICTFREYPRHNKPFIIRLAGAGFYYASQEDEAVCYVCGVRRRGWTDRDSPRRIHSGISPRCNFLLKNDEVNVPVPSMDSNYILERTLNGEGSTGRAQAPTDTVTKMPTEETIIWEGSPNEAASLRPVSPVDDVQTVRDDSPTRATAAKSSISKNAAKHNRPGQMLGASNATEAAMMGVNTEQPKHPHYAIKSVRLTSYAGWPKDLTQTPDIMAGAGYYYAGFADCVRCFFCGIGLRHWTPVDNVWVEHARWSPQCVYLRQMKGQEFIDLVKMAIQYSGEDVSEESVRTVSKPQDDESKRQAEISKLLLGDAAQSVLEMGYQPGIIKQAIAALLATQGADAISAEGLMEEVLNIEELEQEMAAVQLSNSAASGMSADRGYSSLSTSEGDKVKGHITKVTDSTSKGSAKNDKGGSIPSKSDNSSKKTRTKAAAKGTSTGNVKGASDNKTTATSDRTAEARKIQAENQILREQTLCKICLDNSVSIVFLPCGHLVTCAECAPALRKCPICRALIKGNVKTYLS